MKENTYYVEESSLDLTVTDEDQIEPFLKTTKKLFFKISLYRRYWMVAGILFLEK